MLMGLGTDIVHLPGFADRLADRASQFVQATFCAAEVAYSEKAVSGTPAVHLAARFAAKEATIKALDQACGGLHIDAPPVRLLDIEVVRDNAGRPWLVLHDTAAALAERIGVDRARLSLSHDGDYATAVVVLERLG